jgi:hypothetical protein
MNGDVVVELPQLLNTGWGVSTFVKPIHLSALAAGQARDLPELDSSAVISRHQFADIVYD